MSTRRFVYLAVAITALVLVGVPLYGLTFGPSGAFYGYQQPSSATQPVTFQVEAPTATPTPTSGPDLRRSFALRGIVTDAAGNLVIEYTDGRAPYSIGASSLRDLPPTSLQGLLVAQGVAGGFYACVGLAKTIYLSKVPQDCLTVDAANGESLP